MLNNIKQFNNSSILFIIDRLITDKIENKYMKIENFWLGQSNLLKWTRCCELKFLK